jgi:DNA-binding response OmpR family regulator
MHQILVVDDEADILDLVSFNLEQEGFRVLGASDGIEAVQRALEIIPDLVVLDLMLPGKDGFRVYKELRADPRTSQVPVIMLTAKGELDEKIMGLELGADGWRASETR